MPKTNKKYSSLPDKEIVNLTLEGDCKAGAELFNRTKLLILNICYMKARLWNLKDVDDGVSDMFQEAAYKMVKYLKSYDTQKPLFPWVAIITRNAAISWIKKNLNGKEEELNDNHLDGSLMNTIYTSHSSSLFIELKEMIFDIIEKIKNHKHKEAILYTFFIPKKQSEICEILDKNTRTFRSDLFRGMLTFEKKWRMAYGDNSVPVGLTLLKMARRGVFLPTNEEIRLVQDDRIKNILYKFFFENLTLNDISGILKLETLEVRRFFWQGLLTIANSRRIFDMSDKKKRSSIDSRQKEALIDAKYNALLQNLVDFLSIGLSENQEEQALDSNVINQIIGNLEKLKDIPECSLPKVISYLSGKDNFESADSIADFISEKLNLEKNLVLEFHTRAKQKLKNNRANTYRSIRFPEELDQLGLQAIKRAIKEIKQK